MLENKDNRIPEKFQIAYEFVKVLFFVYCFLLSIDLMGISFKASGKGVTDTLAKATSNPFIGLIIGIVTTSIIQSSSTTTAIVVTMVGSGLMTLQGAIPIIMGANIGTTVTCTIVSFGYVGHKNQFERSFGASIVHDMFNILSVMIWFPIEYRFGIIEWLSLKLTSIFGKVGGFTIISPLEKIVKPLSNLIAGMIGNHHWILLILALIFLFFSMKKIIENMKGIVMEKVELVLNRYIFRNALISFLFGMFFTALVQSSSITTSLLIPLVGAGALTLEQVFPYMLGANIGTTITAMLAALTLGVEGAVAVAFSHLIFNILGISVFYPLRRIPMWIARTIAGFVSKSKKHFLVYLVIFILLHTVPIVFALLD